jgi:hypothetical protein
MGKLGSISRNRSGAKLAKDIGQGKSFQNPEP